MDHVDNMDSVTNAIAKEDISETTPDHVEQVPGTQHVSARPKS